MKRIVIAAVALVSLGACASTPAAKSPADMILGTWNCKAESEGVSTDAVITYVKGGTATMDASVGVKQGGMAIDLAGKGDASWKFLPDGKIEETITRLTVTSGKMGGNPVPVGMIQPMVDQMVVNQPVKSTVVFSDASFVSTDEEGVVTTCTR
jgi:hypothetical protein